MRAKIIGILICIMLMTAFLTTAQDVENLPVKHESEQINSISFDEVLAPEWEVGYKWTYKIDRFTVNFEQPEVSLYMDVKIDNFPIEVTMETEDSYELTYEAGISGSFWIEFDLGDGPINISFELISAKIEGTMLLNKTDLGINSIHPKIYGTLDVKIEEQPYINFPFKLHQEVEGTINLDIVMENPYPPIIKFPLNTTGCWGLPETNFTLGGTIESPILEKIDKNNREWINPILENLSKFINGPIISRLLEFSNLLKDILPIIDICYILTDYLEIGCKFTIPEVPPIICSFITNKELVTVPAGTFECHNISMAGTNLANIYYNDTEVLNIVKIAGNFEDIVPSIGYIGLELISYDV